MAMASGRAARIGTHSNGPELNQWKATIAYLLFGIYQSDKTSDFQAVTGDIFLPRAAGYSGGCIMILTDSRPGQAAYGASIARLSMAMNDIFDVS
jgi:hypothetical protein